MAEDKAASLVASEAAKAVAIAAGVEPPLLSADYLQLEGKVQVSKVLAKQSPEESVLFSDLVTKVNRKNKRQERALLITTGAVYNLTPDGYKSKRRIALGDISGLSVSNTSNEFVIHVPKEYDYRLCCARQSELVETLQIAFKAADRAKKDLIVERLDISSLWEVCMTKDRIKAAKKAGRPAMWIAGAKAAAAVVERRASMMGGKVEEGAVDHAAGAGGAGAGARKRRRMTGWANEETDVTTEDFDNLKVLGKGSFGKVMLVRKKDSGKLYAMKVMRKEAIVARNQVEHTKAERKILETMSHPFLVALHYAFQSPAKLYLVIDLMTGGELFFHLQRAGKFTEDRARFYAAEIALGIGHLHSVGIVYRDLKPENILLDNTGHIRLTDFGLSKHTGGQESHTFCGTPEYLAPEIIEGRGHGKEVDWWSLGILIYEMIVGIPPFFSQNISLMYDLIQSAELSIPADVSPEAADLLRKMLERDQTKRLGFGETDVEDLKAHPFFASVDWEALFRKDVEPPFVPDVVDAEDTSNFDTEFTAQPAIDSVVTPSAIASADGDGAKFEGFTFVEKSSLARAAAAAAAEYDVPDTVPEDWEASHAL